MSLVDTAADVPLHGHDGLKGAAGMRALASRLAPRVLLQLTAGPIRGQMIFSYGLNQVRASGAGKAKAKARTRTLFLRPHVHTAVRHTGRSMSKCDSSHLDTALSPKIE